MKVNISLSNVRNVKFKILFQTGLVLALNNTMKQKEDGSVRSHLASGLRALRSSPVNMPPNFLSFAKWQCSEPNLSFLTFRLGLHVQIIYNYS